MTSVLPSGTQEQKIQGLQHSVLFLQQEHAHALQGLHQEIVRLQQKCSALTFQVTQDPKHSNIPHNTGSSLKDIFESEIRELRLDNTKLKGILETKDKRILLIEGQLKSKEQKHNDDLKNVQRKINDLQHELEQKSTNIVYLTTQLHQSKFKTNIKKESDYSSESRENATIILNPSPPRGSPRTKYSLRRVATSPAAANVTGLIQSKSSHQLAASDIVLEHSIPKTNSSRFSTKYKQSINDPARPANGHSHIKKERELKLATNNKPKPTDYEDFINMSQSHDVISKPSMEPLPPITTRSGRQLRDSTMKTRTRVLRNKATASSSGDVETIILETNLTSPDKSYRQLQNSSTK